MLVIRNISFKLRQILSFTKLQNVNIRYSSTIYALSSGYGKCGVAVIRVSGEHAGDALKIMTDMEKLPNPRYAILKNIYDSNNKNILDKGLILWFPGPKSFTGEDCCEFQIHGGPAVISSVLNALQNIKNLRPAEPGEFTKRAFYNGKLDLTEVEGLADLLQAETEMQRKQAFLQTNGALKTVYNNWRSILVKCVANIEAYIDFEESEVLDDNLFTNTFLIILNLYNNIQKHLKDGSKGEILRNGIKTVIIGEPNVGKSSLLNLLCDRPAAIVTPIAGTTRDLLNVTLDINGYPLILTDTAGLRTNTLDIVEQEGIKRAIDSIGISNLIIFVIDINKFINSKYNKNINEFLQDYVKQIGLLNINVGDYLPNGILHINLAENQTEIKKFIIVFNKTDLIESNDTPSTMKNCDSLQNIAFVSCTEKTGFSDFIKKLTFNLEEICGTPSEEHPCMNKDRHRYLLVDCSNYLDKFLIEVNNPDKDVVIMAEYLRSALKQLGKLTGNVTTEDLLDIIFKDFCIGK